MHLPRGIALAVAGTAGVLVLTPLLRIWTWPALVPDPVEWYLRPPPTRSTFTLFPWSAFVFAGMALGEGLAAMGYPPCPGGEMVSNTAWRGDGRAWIERISSLRGDTSSDGLMRAAIMIDAQPVAGDLELFEPVRDALLALGRDALWLHQFVLPAIEFSAPLTLFGGLRGKGSAVDLKKGGIFPVEHGSRLPET